MPFSLIELIAKEQAGTDKTKSYSDPVSSSSGPRGSSQAATHSTMQRTLLTHAASAIKGALTAESAGRMKTGRKPT